MMASGPIASEYRLLVVDDDVDTCQNLHDILTSLQFCVDTAHSGPQAMEMIQPGRYAVALLDLRMPGLSGLDVFRSIQERSPGTRGVLVSAFVSDDCEREAIRLGFWMMFHKPVDPARLVSLLRSAVEEEASRLSGNGPAESPQSGERSP